MAAKAWVLVLVTSAFDEYRILFLIRFAGYRVSGLRSELPGKFPCGPSDIGRIEAVLGPSLSLGRRWLCDLVLS